MYSFTVEMENGRIVPLIQYVVSLAVTEAVKHVCDNKVSISCLLPPPFFASDSKKISDFFFVLAKSISGFAVYRR